MCQNSDRETKPVSVWGIRIIRASAARATGLETGQKRCNGNDLGPIVAVADLPESATEALPLAQNEQHRGRGLDG